MFFSVINHSFQIRSKNSSDEKLSKKDQKRTICQSSIQPKEFIQTN